MKSAMLNVPMLDMVSLTVVTVGVVRTRALEVEPGSDDFLLRWPSKSLSCSLRRTAIQLLACLVISAEPLQREGSTMTACYEISQIKTTSFRFNQFFTTFISPIKTAAKHLNSLFLLNSLLLQYLIVIPTYM